MDYHIIEAAKENALMENAITNGINNAKAKVKGAIDAGKARAKKFDRDTYINSLSIGDAKKAIKTGLTKKERVELAAVKARSGVTHVAGNQLAKVSNGKLGGDFHIKSNQLANAADKYVKRGKVRKGVAAGVGIAGAAGATAGIAAHLLKKKKQKEDSFADGYKDALMEMYDYDDYYDCY